MTSALFYSVFGGSFDPPTLGHVAVVDAVREKYGCGVIVVPSADHPWKRSVACYSERVGMLCDLFNGTDVIVSRAEEEFGVSKTLDLMRCLSGVHGPNLRFVAGLDVAREVCRWHGGMRITEEFPFIIIRRPGCEYVGDEWFATPPHDFIDIGTPGVSSTMARSVAMNGDLAGIVHRSIADRVMHNYGR